MLDTLIKLYVNFLCIGSFAFGGGYAVIPLIKKYVVDSMQWLSVKELNDLISLSQITPGPIAINAATFIGVKTAGILGAIVATSAEVTMSCILMLILGHFIFRGKKIKFIDYILKGLKPAICGLILVATIDLFKSSIFANEIIRLESFYDVKFVGLVGFFIGVILSFKKDFGVIKIIICSAVIGLIIGFAI